MKKSYVRHTHSDGVLRFIPQLVQVKGRRELVFLKLN